MSHTATLKLLSDISKLTNLYFGHDFYLYETNGFWRWEGFGRYRALGHPEGFDVPEDALANAVYSLLREDDTSIADCASNLETLDLPVVI